MGGIGMARRGKRRWAAAALAVFVAALAALGPAGCSGGGTTGNTGAATDGAAEEGAAAGAGNAGAGNAGARTGAAEAAEAAGEGKAESLATEPPAPGGAAGEGAAVETAGPGQAAGGAPESRALEWIAGRLQEMGRYRYVYKDFGSGENRYTQFAWMGSDASGASLPDDALDTASPVAFMEGAAGAGSGASGEAGAGATSIHARIPLTDGAGGGNGWGGWLLLNGTLAAGAEAPQPSFGEADAGQDMRGALRLTFAARAADGGTAGVEFFTAGLGYEAYTPVAPFADSCGKQSLGYVRLGDAWERFEIDLSSPDLDLGRVGLGFGFAADAAHNEGADAVDVYVDEIRFEFAEGGAAGDSGGGAAGGSGGGAAGGGAAGEGAGEATGDAAGAPGALFLPSYDAAAPGDESAVLNATAYLYDNAVACIALLAGGETGAARQVAEAIRYAAGHDRAFSDGRLRNAYAAGAPESPPGWLGDTGLPFARLPSFYDAAQDWSYEDQYAASSHTEPVAWAVLALCQAQRALDPGGSGYVSAAVGAGRFLLGFRDEAGGGFRAGLLGFDDAQERLAYKSTSGNVALWAAFGALARLAPGAADRAAFDEAAGWAAAFVQSMYEPAAGCYYSGTLEDGTGVNRVPVPLNANAWAALVASAAAQGSPSEQASAASDSAPAGAVAASAIADAAKKAAFVKGVLCSQNGYGYKFSDASGDGYWIEGTAQASLMLRALGDAEGAGAIVAALKAYDRNADGSYRAASVLGYETGFPEWVFPDRDQCLASTAWAALAELGANPFQDLGAG
jgi:hypothetical protein